MDFAARRVRMVNEQIAARGVSDPRVLAVMRTVPRERFLPEDQTEFAYEDTPLGIAKLQTISQPYIVALMAESLELRGDEHVLEIGTGSGYGAAVLGRLARVVHTIERHGELAHVASERLAANAFDNVTVVHGDGTMGLAEYAPFDAIIATAGGPRVPTALLEQLAVGGRLVMPIGQDRALQTLVRVRRLSEREYKQEELQSVRFVPLIGAQGWKGRTGEEAALPPSSAGSVTGLPLLVRECAEPIDSIDDPRLDALIDRIGDARVVLLGESTHGTSEFYGLRAAITRRLVERRGFRILAIEADWPDAAVVNRYVQSLANGHPEPGDAFRRFPLWMWRNQETLSFIEWLRGRNAEKPPDDRAGFFGLDLYSLFTSIRAVLGYLDRVDPEAARTARVRYACLSPWEGDPQTYARAALTGRYRVCEQEALAILKDMTARRLEYIQHDGVRFMDAVQNARLVANAEHYYRAMYYGHAESWNLRDRHMFETLKLLLGEHGAGSRAVVWAHNSHLGNASATEMAARGEINLGQLCRKAFGDACFSVGFGTDHGEVAAAAEWDGPMEVMRVRPAHALSYERLFHESGVPAYLLPLRHARRPELREDLALPRLERAIGVVYRPDTELQSHYFQAVLPSQFDEYVWFDETSAITALSSAEARALPPTHPLAWR